MIASPRVVPQRKSGGSHACGYALANGGMIRGHSRLTSGTATSTTRCLLRKVAGAVQGFFATLTVICTFDMTRSRGSPCWKR